MNDLKFSQLEEQRCTLSVCLVRKRGCVHEVEELVGRQTNGESVRRIDGQAGGPCR